MPFSIRPYTENDIGAVKDFNGRLQAGGISFRFPEHHIPAWLPPGESRSIYQEFFLAIEDNKTVRGAYILKHQRFAVGGQILSVGNYQLPLSEGSITSQYNLVGMQLVSDAHKRQPLLYALGMGGTDNALPRMLKALGWRITRVPFYFKVCHPSDFLRGVHFLRQSPFLKILCDIGATTGLGYAAIKGWQFSKAKRRSHFTPYSYEVVNSFDTQVDGIWAACEHVYSLAAVRSLSVLSVLYPQDNKRFIRLIVIDRKSNKVAGWAVLLDTHMSGHKQFGDLRVGSIVDCLAPPEEAEIVIAAATELLTERGVDLIVSNQSHPWWCSALTASGFLKGPSNFALATSPKLTQMIKSEDPAFSKIHVNRSDGDGPINL